MLKMLMASVTFALASMAVAESTFPSGSVTNPTSPGGYYSPNQLAMASNWQQPTAARNAITNARVSNAFSAKYGGPVVQITYKTYGNATYAVKVGYTTYNYRYVGPVSYNNGNSGGAYMYQNSDGTWSWAPG